MDSKVYWLAWHLVLAGQARKFWKIMKHFGTPENAWLAKEPEFDILAGSSGEMLQRRKSYDLSKVAQQLNHPKYKTLLHSDPDYPKQLQNIYDPPPVLFLRGRLDLLNELSVAFVGSRKATSYGLSVTESLAGDLAAAGIVILSGMARGIDSAAHRAALEVGGKTIAVLGSGLNVVYPKENTRLRDEIAEKGTLLSEFPWDTPPNAWHFPVRNRIISGLSEGVVVTEAAERSGALITAHTALEQGREVMAVPGNITSKFSFASNSLIKQGAIPVMSAQDILENLDFRLAKSAPIHSAPVHKEAVHKEAVHKEAVHKEAVHKEAVHKEAESDFALDEQERLLLEILNSDNTSSAPMEVITQKSGLAAEEVMSSMMFLEIKGLVKQTPGGLYSLTSR